MQGKNIFFVHFKILTASSEPCRFRGSSFRFATFTMLALCEAHVTQMLILFDTDRFTLSGHLQPDRVNLSVLNLVI